MERSIIVCLEIYPTGLVDSFELYCDQVLGQRQIVALGVCADFCGSASAALVHRVDKASRCFASNYAILTDKSKPP